jgi:CRISPR-associated protein Cmr1
LDRLSANVEGGGYGGARERSTRPAAGGSASYLMARSGTSTPEPMGPPSFLSLPAPKPRRLKGGSELREIAVSLATVTPILGGAAATRTVDEVDVIRVPSIRGQLRFWWRAVHGHAFNDAKELARREGQIWGRMGKAEGGRSAVDVRVTVDKQTVAKDALRPTLAEGYALWPAERPPPTAPRWKAGLNFQLVLRVTKDHEEEVLRALRAWIIFGGYGGRVRRGCGSLTLVTPEDRRKWLPKDATPDEFRRLLGDTVL